MAGILQTASVATILIMASLFAISPFADIGKPPTQPVTIWASGDMMVGRYVETLMNLNGADYPFSALKPHLQNYDLVMSNLEGPIMTNHIQTPDFTTNFSFKPETAETLKRNGFNLITIANNHTFDKGAAGYTQTQQYLDAAGIQHFGHPAEVGDQYVLYKEINGHKLAFVGFHNATLPLNNEQALAQIRQLETSGKVDLTIVNIHWGIEYQRTNSAAQQQLAHQMIDAGADAIIGHHPHVVQNVEVYQDRAIFYSLGNLIFDQYFSPYTQEGLTLGLTITDDNIEYKLIPVQISKSQPQIMNAEATQTWLQDYTTRSDSTLATQIERGIITTNR